MAVVVQVVEDMAADMSHRQQTADVHGEDWAVVINRWQQGSGCSYGCIVLGQTRIAVVNWGVLVGRSHPVATDYVVVASPGINHIVARSTEDRVISAASSDVFIAGLINAEGLLNYIANFFKDG